MKANDFSQLVFSHYSFTGKIVGVKAFWEYVVVCI